MHAYESRRMYELGLELVSRGLSVIPTGGGRTKAAKQPHYNALKATGHTALDAMGELQATWKAFQERQPTEAELYGWFVQEGARGIGMVTGSISGLVVVDVDEAGLPLLAALGWTPHVVSPSGGAHLYVRHPGWYVPSNASKNKAALPAGFDVRGDGGYIMLPPSRTAKGQYRRTGERKPLSRLEIPEAVAWEGQEYQLRQALGLASPPPPAPAAPMVLGRSRPAPQDDERCPMWLILDRAAEHAKVSRNKGAFYLGMWANANGYHLEETLAHIEEYLALVAGVKDTLFPHEEAAKAVRSGYRIPRKDPWRREEEK